MPLRDHFREPTTRSGTWGSLHGGWPMVMVQQIRKQLPPGFVAGLQVRLGAYFELDFAAFKKDENDIPGFLDSGGLTAVLAPPKPTWAVDTDLPEDDIFEVEIYDVQEERLLVAVIEIVSPANKDRPDKRRAFAGKCGALLKKGVSVSIVDLVTIRQANLYAEMMAFIGHKDPHLGPEPPTIYVSSTRWTPNAEGTRARLESWFHPMTIGQPLPALPIWLGETHSLEFDLERSYEQACEDLSIP
ncbi:MAG: DUF4058 family protein [Fimbriiglobus sp.]